MEMFLRKYDKDCMKIMMLKHEETFRQQVVHELHRLYRVQKILMRDMKNNDELKRQRLVNCTRFNLGDRDADTDSCLLSNRHRQRRPRRRVLNLELPADEYIERAEADMTLELEQASDIELTLTVGSSWRKREETSFTSDSGASFSTSSTESGGIKLTAHGWETRETEDANISYDNGIKDCLELEGLRDERLKQPSWHFQCLNLRMT
ncbi:hypothetical protein B296_00036882 [Ensete ventricosum]|uniref:Uncharacterized protein n=1 Tax=Ensete ventricosum TaxID=4639 RepID=A0A426Z5U1_ENSVE|nr:hypothetical protein B296_00036882 [Ensete ventricosum]